MNDNVKLWLEALRSGEYKQGYGTLAQSGADIDSDDVHFCCLGVACQVAIENGLNVKVINEDTDSVVMVRSYDGCASSLPITVQVWLGVCSPNGVYVTPQLIGNRLADSLASANDNGASFEEIADLIESESDGLFANQQQ